VIPGSFAYHRPNSAQEAVKLLAELGEEARPIAGGHSLIPMMKLRLARPEHLVDLGKLAELKFIREEAGEVLIGAMTTQHELIASELLARKIPIIREAALVIADPQVRYQGTLGGNIANGDPGNDMPALMLMLDATYEVLGKGGSRRLKARAFYQGAYFTALAPGEIVTAVRIPAPAAGHGWAYEKLKRKVGDYAVAAAGVILEIKSGKCTAAAIGLTNLGETPLLAASAAAALVGTSLDAAALARAATAAEAQVAPASDGRGPAEYRRKVAGVVLRRAIERAKSRAA